MNTWEKAGRTVNERGTTITYRAAGTDMSIESRKRYLLAISLAQCAACRYGQMQFSP